MSHLIRELFYLKCDFVSFFFSLNIQKHSSFIINVFVEKKKPIQLLQ